MPIWDELTDAIESGVIVTNPQGYCIYSNAYARTLLPLDPMDTPFDSHFSEELRNIFRGEHLPREGQHITAHLKYRSAHHPAEMDLFVKSRPAGGAVVFLNPVRPEISEVMQSEERFRSLVEISPDAICMLSERLDIVYANSSMAALLGIPDQQAVGLNLWQVVEPEDQTFLLKLVQALPSEDQIMPPTEQHWKSLSGERLEVEVVCRSWVEPNTAERITVLIARDIRDRKEAERQLRESEARHRTMLSAIPDTVFLIDRSGVCKDVHSPDPDLLAAPVEMFLGKRIYDLFPPHLAEMFEHVISRALETAELQTIEYALDLGQSVQFFEARVARHSEEDVLAVVRDISAQKASLERLEYLNQSDQLTGLYNRAYLQDTADQLILTADPQNVVGVMLWDVNRFKDINDSLGFAVGDELLQAVARKLRKHVAHPDLLGRLDGDEFAMVLRRSSISELMQVAYSVQNAFEQPLHFAGQQHILSLAMGLAIYPHQGQTYHDLLRQANSALRYAKLNRQGVAVYRPEFDLPSSERMLIEQELRDAIQKRKLVLQYQPLWDIHQQKLWGVECLVRLQNRQGRFISPEEFINLAEETGLIRRLDQRVIELAMEELRDLDFVCSVNLSPSTIRDSEFFAWMRDFALRLGERASRLQIEVTEGTLMQERDVVVSRLEEMRRWGIKVALDDFGVGYSSMSYLKHLPLDVLKLDRSFTTYLGESETDNRLMDSLIQLGHGLGFKVIAEGVETSEQVQWLRTHRCDLIQGYHISRPLSHRDLRQWMGALK
ncbi:putative bifunctional diguanylate cyclase/phosphodiesterase [Deinococcus cellulosilyticus]|uniref:Uncharacterized protein n=1 Tax=Deinococcus cellulosilyticus (strain DSM 18568 / NBRC 106333 / KACC 11606 / 5516J-15) TaxID=1223518 RepID=A0A511N5T4_DEIC1|nr:EAL domain-containing protein [Deinococcus cellulosilyticus]GEM47796.1 hypothetical protein DC3_34310 [Deinococcus cellulosilyticus NBRC 106333 = KACC 11606]